MNFKDIYDQFVEPTKENFPIESCNKQNEREPNVFDSDTPYLCLMIDKRFDDYWELFILYPYICKESGSVTTFGWTDRNGNVFCNITNSTNLWDEFVVGFQKYSESESDDKELWDGFLTKIDEQYDD